MTSQAAPVQETTVNLNLLRAFQAIVLTTTGKRKGRRMRVLRKDHKKFQNLTIRMLVKEDYIDCWLEEGKSEAAEG